MQHKLILNIIALSLPKVFAYLGMQLDEVLSISQEANSFMETALGPPPTAPFFCIAAAVTLTCSDIVVQHSSTQYQLKIYINSYSVRWILIERKHSNNMLWLLLLIIILLVVWSPACLELESLLLFQVLISGETW